MGDRGGGYSPMPALRDRLPRLARDSRQQLSPRWDYGTDFRNSVGVRRRRRPPPPFADRGGCPRRPLAESAAPRRPGARGAVDNFAHLRILWTACKSLISFITYAQLTENTSHDSYYVKSQSVPDRCFAAFMGSAMRETSICG